MDVIAAANDDDSIIVWLSKWKSNFLIVGRMQIAWIDPTFRMPQCNSKVDKQKLIHKSLCLQLLRFNSKNSGHLSPSTITNDAVFNEKK